MVDDFETKQRSEEESAAGSGRGGDTAQKILTAAATLFAERGFAGVSIRDIAAAAGVNKGLVFYHHESKAHLFETLLDEYYAAYSAALDAALASDGSRDDRLHRLLDANLDFIEDHFAYARLVQLEIAQGTENLERIRRGMGVLHDAVATVLGDLTPGSGPLASRHFFVTFSGMVNTYFIYATAIEPLWGADPMSSGQRRERREHLHWMLDAVAGRLASRAADPDPGNGSS